MNTHKQPEVVKEYIVVDLNDKDNILYHSHNALDAFNFYQRAKASYASLAYKRLTFIQGDLDDVEIIKTYSKV
jgi:hypothetical protein